jgi:hypothetical protein
MTRLQKTLFLLITTLGVSGVTAADALARMPHP